MENLEPRETQHAPDAAAAAEPGSPTPWTEPAPTHVTRSFHGRELVEAGTEMRELKEAGFPGSNVRKGTK